LTGAERPTPIAGGLRAKVACLDAKQLAQTFVGRESDAALVVDMPADADPCGERGVHTCVYAGPMFSAPIPLEPGQVVNHDGFAYPDFSIAVPVEPSWFYPARGKRPRP
jgi:diphthamide synthase (EF-2-diphthine--ammonia ligase)